MGRSRGIHNSAEEELGPRSKRKKGASSAENIESAATGTGTIEGKRALYHCNYCNKDISGKIRIKCVMCPDFDLCVECFSVGAEITPHKSNHPYRVMDNLSFPLIGPDWNADEEILLLEGIEMYGLGNWTEVAEHVGTKSKAQCIEHYTNAYMNSPCFPLPDMSHVIGKNKKELLDMAKGHGQGKNGFPNLGELTLKEESTFSPSRVKAEESGVGRSPSTLSTDADSMAGCSGTAAAATSAVKKAAEVAQVKAAPDAIKLEDRSIGVKKLKSSGEEGPSLTQLSGYNPKRQEFDPEYDNDAEKSLADMEFKDTDTEEEREIKLEMLHIYSRRLDERKRRKDFILERNLICPDPLMKELAPDERELYQRYNVFMRFHSQEEHEKMMKTIIEEHRIRKHIKLLQEAREAGCRTASELDRFLEQKKKQEAEEAARKAKESGQVGPSGKAPQRGNRTKAEPDAKSLGGVTAGMESSGRDASSTTAGRAIMSVLNDWDVTGLPGADLLSPSEEQLCNELKLIPAMYLKMKEVVSVQILQGNITKKSDAHSLFKIDVHKIDRVFDMLAKTGVAPP